MALALTSSLLMGKTLVTVNGHPITDTIIPPGYEQLDQTKYNEFIQDLVKREVLHADLLKSSLVQNSKFKEIFQKQKSLAEQEYQKNTGKSLNSEQIRTIKGDIAIAIYQQNQFEKTTVSNSEIQSFYNNNQDKFNFPDAIHIANMVFTNQNEAQSAIQQLQTSTNIPATFKSVSEQYGIKSSAGWITRDISPQNLFDQVYPKPINTLITTPIQSELGYHVVYLINKKPAGTLPFEKAKKRIEQVLKQKRVIENLQNKVDRLYGKAEIVIN